MSDYRCSKCSRVLEHIGVPQHIRAAQMYGTVVDIGSEPVPDEIKADPYVYRGIHCRSCNRVFCPSCSNMQGDVCVGCGSRQVMPAYRPLLKRLGAPAAAGTAPPRSPSPSLEAWLFDESWAAYRTVLKKYAVFFGRARRREFWLFLGLQVVIFTIFLVLGNVSVWLALLSVPYALAMGVPTISLVVRRLHDTGRSGQWASILAVPFAGWAVILVLAAQDGQAGENRYGPDPKTDVVRPDAPGPSGPVARLIGKHDQFLVLEIRDPAAAWAMVLRESMVREMVEATHLSFDETARTTAGQLFAISRGTAKQDDVVRQGAAISERARVNRYPRASAAARIQALPSSWEVPVVVVSWLS